MKSWVMIFVYDGLVALEENQASHSCARLHGFWKLANPEILSVCVLCGPCTLNKTNLF